MSTRGQYAADSCTLPVVDTDERYAVAVAAPILSEGDVLGCVLFVAAHGDGPAKRDGAQARAGCVGLPWQADGELSARSRKKRQSVCAP